jgi:hypothetical protein
MRGVEDNDVDDLLATSDRLRQGSSTTDPISTAARNSQVFYHLTMSEPLDADLSLLECAANTDTRGTGSLSASASCGSDCW